jgi:hypothetical protein
MIGTNNIEGMAQEIIDVGRKELMLMTPEEFRDEYAPRISVKAARDLFHHPTFPLIKIGVRHYTTRKAASEWLGGLGTRKDKGGDTEHADEL